MKASVRRSIQESMRKKQAVRIKEEALDDLKTYKESLQNVLADVKKSTEAQDKALNDSIEHNKKTADIMIDLLLDKKKTRNQKALDREKIKKFRDSIGVKND